MQMLFPIALLLPFLGSLLLLLFPHADRQQDPTQTSSTKKRTRSYLNPTGFSCAIIFCAWVIMMGAQTPNPLRYEISWVPDFDLNFIFRLDGLAWLFAMLVLSIGLLVTIYSRYYFSEKISALPRFLSLILAFMGSMLGLVLSGHLIQLVVFWEMTSVVSFLLIGYQYDKIEARRGARTAMVVTAAGGVCLFLASVLIKYITQSYDLDIVLNSSDVLIAHPLYSIVVLLLLVGAFTKSAQFPFHFWLPQAMAAPTPASAYLHSATLVKAGIFVIMRLWPVLIGAEFWTGLVGGVGAIVMLLGGFLSIFQTDLKRLLAYSTLGHLGLITFLLGLGTPLSFIAAIFHTINHGIFKASLFMSAGIVESETGTRRMHYLGKLHKNMPMTTVLAVSAGAAMAGVPLLNGFLSKEMFFAEAVSSSKMYRSYTIPCVAIVASIFTITYSLRWVLDVFFKKPLLKEAHIIQAKDPAVWVQVSVGLLVFLCFVVGIAPEQTIGPFLKNAAVSVLGQQMPNYRLSIWHGWDLPLLMSAFTFAGGAFLYLSLGRLSGYFCLDGRNQFVQHLDGKRMFESALVMLTCLSGRLAALLSSRSLQSQFLMIFLFTTSAIFFLFSGRVKFGTNVTPVDPSFLFLWVIGWGCAIGAAQRAKYHRLVALVLLGGSGLVSMLTFAWFSAPDLALTQMVVESVTTILLLLGLRWLPRRLIEKKTPVNNPPLVAESGFSTFSPVESLEKLLLFFRRGRDFIVAAFLGIEMAFLSYAVLTRPHVAQRGISEFFARHALSDGGGANIVNVILVDFRAFDTLGEITVLGVVALTVYALLRRFRPAPESVDTPIQQQEQIVTETPGTDAERGYLLITGMFLRLLLPVLWLVAVFFLLRGHNLPGGGFIAGLIVTVGITLQYLTAGSIWVESRLRVLPYWWIVSGLFISILSGMASWIFDYPFLTTHTSHVSIPIIGMLELPSAFLFDLGVFATVLGVSTLLLLSLAHQSVRRQRMPAHAMKAERAVAST